MQGIGTGSWEYIVMIIAYLAISIALIFFSVIKWKKEGYAAWTSFESFFVSMQLFFIFRLAVLAFLLYLRLSYLPLLEEELTDKPGELEFQYLDDTGKQLLLTWELLFVFGSCLLFTASSLMIYKWRYLLTRDEQGNVIATIVLNAIAVIPCIVLITLQYLLKHDRSVWVHITYYYIGAALVCAAFLLAVNNTRLASTMEHDRVRNDYTLKLYKVVLATKFSIAATVIALLVRAGSLTLDSAAYNYISSGSTLQHIWNIFFKYVLWIAPELVFSIGLSYAFFKTEEFHGMLAVLSGNGMSDLKNKFNIQAPRAQRPSERINVDVKNLRDVIGDEDVQTIPKTVLEQTLQEADLDTFDTYSDDDVELHMKTGVSDDYRLIRDE